MPVILLLSGALAAPAPTGPEPVDPDELDAALGEAEAALRDLDDAAFRQRIAEVTGTLLPALAGPTAPAQAARLHRLVAVHLRALGDEAGAAEALAAAKRADPGTAWPPDLLGPDHPLRTAFAELPADAPTRRLPDPRVGSVAVDGVVSRDRPREAMAIVQRLDDDGSVLGTWYLGPQEPAPLYDAVPHARNRLIVASAAVVLAAGGVYAASWAERGALFSAAADPTADADALRRRATLTNVTSVGAGLLLGAGGMLAGAAVVTGTR